MISNVINSIHNEAEMVFDEVDTWFNESESILNYRPESGGWSIGEILEHISLTNQFLLILIKKATTRALEKPKPDNYKELLNTYELDSIKLKQVGEHKLFYWNRPVHMEPGGTADLNEVKDKIQMQVAECLNCLQQLSNGEGILYKTTMSVNNFGKIDVYHYISFLVQHAKRHITQMENNKKEIEQRN